MNLLLTAFCEHAQLRPDGKLDIHGAFHDLAAPGFPAKQDRMVLVIAIEWDAQDAGRYLFQVDLVGDGPHPSFTVNGETEIQARAQDARPARTVLVMPLEDIVFPKPGRYQLVLKVKGDVLQGTPLHLWEVADQDRD